MRAPAARVSVEKRFGVRFRSLGRDEGDRQPGGRDVGRLGVDGKVLRDTHPARGKLPLERAAVVEPAEMHMAHRRKHRDLLGIRSIAAADAEILEGEDTVAAFAELDVGEGRPPRQHADMARLDAVLAEASHDPPPVLVIADGAEIGDPHAEPRQLHRDVDRIAADQREAERRTVAVDAIVADRGDVEAVHRRAGASRRRACSSAASSAGGPASPRDARSAARTASRARSATAAHASPAISRAGQIRPYRRP